MTDIDNCVQYENKNLDKCYKCDGFGNLLRRTCKDYKTRKLETLI